ncbi:MAG: tyrosine-type recombinase/integrase [Aestuariivirga sp.]
MALPKGVFPVKGRKGQVYWYYQEGRGTDAAGKRYRLPKGPTDPEFWTAYNAAKNGGHAAGSIAATIEEYKASPSWDNLRPNSQKIYGIALNRIAKVWGDLRPDQVTPAALAAFRDTMSDRPTTANFTLSVAREFFRFCAERGLCTSNPAREPRRLAVDEDAGAKPVPEAVYQHIISTAPRAIARYFILARATGQRISDVLRMRPTDRDGAGISMTITKRRKDRKHWVPLSQAQIRDIDGWDGAVMAAYILNERGKPYTPDGFRAIYKVWRARPENAVVGDITPHDLRATAVCDDRIAGYSHQEISARRGMSIQMVMRYSRHIDQRLIASASNERETKLQTAEKRIAKQKSQVVVLAKEKPTQRKMND